MNKTKQYTKLLNLLQAQWFYKNGAKLYSFGLAWSDRQQKNIVYFLYEKDEKFESLMKIWRERTR